MPWISLYWLFAVICLFMFLIILASKFPKVELKSDEKAGPLKTHILLLKKPVVIAYFIGIVLLCWNRTRRFLLDVAIFI